MGGIHTMPLTRAELNSHLELHKLPQAPKAQGHDVEMKILLPPVYGEGTYSSIPHKLPSKTENHKAENVRMHGIYVFWYTLEYFTMDV